MPIANVACTQPHGKSTFSLRTVPFSPSMRCTICDRYWDDAAVVGTVFWGGRFITGRVCDDCRALLERSGRVVV